jgi:hypothetical protein
MPKSRQRKTYTYREVLLGASATSGSSFICGASTSKQREAERMRRRTLAKQANIKNAFSALPFSSLDSNETEKEVKTAYAGSSLSEMPFFNIQNNDDLAQSNNSKNEFDVIANNDGEYGIVHNEEENGKSDQNCSIM